jgi:hypothetical protein
VSRERNTNARGSPNNASQARKSLSPSLEQALLSAHVREREGNGCDRHRTTRLHQAAWRALGIVAGCRPNEEDSDAATQDFTEGEYDYIVIGSGAGGRSPRISRAPASAFC